MLGQHQSLRKVVARLKLLCKDRLYRQALVNRMILSIFNKIYPKISHFTIEENGLKVRYSAKDRTISLYALGMGNYHKKDVLDVVKLAESFGYNFGGHLLEFGGNIGSTTVGAVHTEKFSHVHTFEPVPSNIELIEANRRINQYEDRISIVAKAISNKIGTVDMKLCHFNNGDNRVSGISEKPEGNLYGEADWQTIQIPTTTGDNYLTSTGLAADDISMVWIDVQGFEGFALDGLQNLLSHRQVPVIVEFWPYGLDQAGSKQIFLSTIRSHFEAVVDIKTKITYDVKDLELLFEKYPAEAYSDLLLLPNIKAKKQH